MQQDVVKILTETHGADHAESLKARQRSASLMLKWGRAAEAEATLRPLLKECEESLGEMHEASG